MLNQKRTGNGTWIARGGRRWWDDNFGDDGWRFVFGLAGIATRLAGGVARAVTSRVRAADEVSRREFSIEP